MRRVSGRVDEWRELNSTDKYRRYRSVYEIFGNEGEGRMKEEDSGRPCWVPIGGGRECSASEGVERR